MTKTEFQEQFKRLRVAGYRLPVFDGITVADVVNEWYGTFGACSKEEFSAAIDGLKKVKTDTFWPATGELWAQVFEVRKARRIRMATQQPSYGDNTPEDVRAELAQQFRQFAAQLGRRMAMPHAEPQAVPDHVLLDQEDQETA